MIFPICPGNGRCSGIEGEAGTEEGRESTLKVTDLLTKILAFVVEFSLTTTSDANTNHMLLKKQCLEGDQKYLDARH